jgi:hypothetical protein
MRNGTLTIPRADDHLVFPAHSIDLIHSNGAFVAAAGTLPSGTSDPGCCASLYGSARSRGVLPRASRCSVVTRRQAAARRFNLPSGAGDIGLELLGHRKRNGSVNFLPRLQLVEPGASSGKRSADRKQLEQESRRCAMCHSSECRFLDRRNVD